ncbi:hypothetical protein B0I37DRAFT_352551 [Chaetomium sp. MPI-CAGE-AT-0009]|nr:hypothetical protein B0I37DRAFT_352551 [Chaetomium sp. MPI-CAGE-AT-0009]
MRLDIATSSSILLTLLSLTFPSAILAARPKNAILLSEVQSLTLHHPHLTTSRRTAPIPQLKCLSPRSLCKRAAITTMRCTNQGSSYSSQDIEWACTASLPPGLRLDRTEVVCEGYASRDDEGGGGGGGWGPGWGPGWGGGGGGGGGGRYDPPPPYPGSGPKPSSSSGGSWTPGFWSGLAGGAAAGYAAGSSRGQRNNARYDDYARFPSRSGFASGSGGDGGSSSSASSSRSGARQESTGFGSTSRR